MRKFISILLTLALSLGLVCAQAEQDNFLISDWKLSYAYEGNVIAEQTVFIYEDGTLEVMDESGSQKGTWKFDGKTLTMLAEGVEIMSVAWDEAAHQFSGDYAGMAITMTMPIEPEAGQSEEGTMSTMPVGGWTLPENPEITDELKNIFWQGMDSYQTGTITVSYTPVAFLGSQVVAGTNYAVLCRSQEINKSPIWVTVYLYQDLEGNVSVIHEAELPLGV